MGDKSMVAPPAAQPHPALLAARLQRAQSRQLRIADDITRFAGSMAFVYLHVALFAVWMLVPRTQSVADADPGGVIGSDLLVHFRDDRPEPAGWLPAGEGRPRFRRTGTGVEDQHGADPRDPYPGRGAGE